MKPIASSTRRSFLRTTGAAAAAFTLVPRHVIAASGQNPPSEQIRIAGIGVGGMGAGDIDAVSGGNHIVALCDVDNRQAGGTFKKFPQARQFRDFRKMFDVIEKDIDAVVVATPDHTHAVAAMAAIRRNKHVYCEKPLAHSVHEVRQLMKAAREHKVVTQLGNQGHSFDSIRTFCEWIWDGAIGNVHTIHAGCSAMNSGLGQLEQVRQPQPIPEGVDWDLWLGPAQERPYHPAYMPGNWRGWVPFGNGTVGDWTCHIVDPVFWALDLGAPKSIQANVKDYNPKTQGLAFPYGEIITYQFPAKAKRGPVTLNWYSGNQPLPQPPELEPGDKPIEYGAVVIGDKGTIVYGSHGAGGVRILPQSKMDAYKRPAPTLPRGLEHHQDWLRSIRAGTKAGSDFADYGGPLTEVAMLGVIAIKLPGTRLDWDTAAMRFTNSDEANQHLNPPYRAGWSL